MKTWESTKNETQKKMSFRKYKNIPIGGFKSKRERDHALWLEGERQAKRIRTWQYEKGFELFASSGDPFPRKISVGRHKPDFLVVLPDGKLEVHECKGGDGTKTEAWRLRKKIFEANYPKIHYIVFDGLPKLDLLGKKFAKATSSHRRRMIWKMQVRNIHHEASGAKGARSLCALHSFSSDA